MSTRVSLLKLLLRFPVSEGVALRGDALTYSNEVEIDAFSFL